MSSKELQHYYDENTALFLRIGSSSGVHAIHRGLWAPGVRNPREAANHINTLLAARIQTMLPETPRSILDLGCGVGGTLFSLARAFPDARLHGVTISPQQVNIAQQLAREQGLQARCGFHVADFEQLDLEPSWDVIIAIESSVHASDPSRFLATCRAQLAPGGVVFVVDDFLARPVPADAHAMRRTIERFQAGWHVPGLCTRAVFDAAAAAEGLTCVQDEDLSRLIRTRRPRDWLVAAVSPPARWLGLIKRPFWANVVGGNALNRAIREGWIQYRMVTLVCEERQENP